MNRDVVVKIAHAGCRRPSLAEARASKLKGHTATILNRCLKYLAVPDSNDLVVIVELRKVKIPH